MVKPWRNRPAAEQDGKVPAQRVVPASGTLEETAGQLRPAAGEPPVNDQSPTMLERARQESGIQADIAQVRIRRRLLLL
jgi:hypothetical protein